MTQFNTFGVLAEPARRAILNQLLAGPAAVNTLAHSSGISQPVASKHLRILRDAGWVEVKPDGQRRLYMLRPEPLTELEDWLRPYRQYWADRLDALSQHLDRQANSANNTGGES